MVLDPKGNEVRFTYASLGTAEYYRKTGKRADGVVLVKEMQVSTNRQIDCISCKVPATTTDWVCVQG